MLDVTPVPILQDNYVWIIRAPDSRECIVVDPGRASEVIDFLKAENLTPVAIIITHSHWDHVDGITDMLIYTPVPVYGPKTTAVTAISEILEDGSTFKIWGIEIKVLSVPGHMPEHLAYVFEHGENTQVFSGDVLFSSGCGRIFVGNHLELKSSLETLAALPDDTLVYPTHEYTLANLEFALAVEPDNQEIKERQRKVKVLRNQGLPSLPTNIAEEKRVNPFLRYREPRVVKQLTQRLESPPGGELEAFAALRQWKDVF